MSTEITPATVVQSLGMSIFSEECKGDFGRAAGQADALLAAARTPEETADALILRSILHVLQGEPARALSLLEPALGEIPDDANRAALALSVVLLATHQSHNAFPDGSGVDAVDVSARWQVVRDLVPLDARWQQAMRGVTDPAAQFKARLIYNFLAAQQTLRHLIEAARFAPSPQPRDQLLSSAAEPAAWLRETAIAAQVPSVAAFADWAAADLYRRSGDLTTAHTLLERARAGYRMAGDQAGEAPVPDDQRRLGRGPVQLAHGLEPGGLGQQLGVQRTLGSSRGGGIHVRNRRFLR